MSGQTQRTTTQTTTKDTQATRSSTNDITVGTLQNDRDGKFADTEGGGIRDDEVKAESGGGLGGFLGNIAESVASILNPQNTQMEDIPEDLLEGLADGTVLRFAFNPTDMEALALGDERRALEAVGDILTVNNPSKEVMEYLLGSEKFTDLVWSGHGAEDGLFTTGANGKSSLMDNETIAAMLEESSIEEVFFAVCNGGKELDSMVNDAGIDTYAYNRQVGDEEALGDLQDFVTGGELDSVEERTITLPAMNLPWLGTLPEMTINIGGEHQMGDPSKREQRRNRNHNHQNPMAAVMAMFGLGPKNGVEPDVASPALEKAAPASMPTATAPAAQAPAAPAPAPAPALAGKSSFDLAATGFNLGGINYL